MNKKMKIVIIVLVVAIILGIIAYIILKPKYELNKAIEYLKYGNYEEAYNYVQSKNNEENKIIIKELISESFCDRVSAGIDKISNITSQCTTVAKKVNKNNIDYTLDDNINIDVQALDAYIALENEISKDMILEELSETYDLYFNSIKYVRENFYDFLKNINNDDFINNINNLASDMNKIANDCFSLADNYKFNPKSIDIFEDIKKYIVN